jgi:epoxyqueuosine reductase
VACGITDLAPVPHADALDRWLAAGYAGTMRYLHRQARKRRDPRRIDPRPRTAVVLLDNYFHPDPLPARGLKLARYARGDDYHRVTMRRLYQLADLLRAHGASYARAFADSGPVPERELAQRAGLGWLGKNTMLIRPGLGSWCVIGSVLTDLPLPSDPPFTADHCGSCTACLDACPTRAFIEPRVLDATRCISYLTIEHKGPIPDDVAAVLDRWGFGCDVCNEVCPWNERFAAPSTVPEFRPRHDSEGRDAAFFERMSDKEFAERYAGTPLERTGVEGMRRNARAAEGGR